MRASGGFELIGKLNVPPVGTEGSQEVEETPRGRHKDQAVQCLYLIA